MIRNTAQSSVLQVSAKLSWDASPNSSQPPFLGSSAGREQEHAAGSQLCRAAASWLPQEPLSTQGTLLSPASEALLSSVTAQPDPSLQQLLQAAPFPPHVKGQGGKRAEVWEGFCLSIMPPWFGTCALSAWHWVCFL